MEVGKTHIPHKPTIGNVDDGVQHQPYVTVILPQGERHHLPLVTVERIAKLSNHKAIEDVYSSMEDGIIYD